jgi:hypothetical protein
MTPTRAQAAGLSQLASEQHDPLAALELLDRSLALGHRRIALIRYLHAQYLGAPLEPRHHEYVHKVAERLSTETIARIATAARARIEGQSGLCGSGRLKLKRT